MSTPIEVLNFLYGRLLNKYGEDPNLDYMLAMRDIVTYMTTVDWAEKDMVYIRQDLASRRLNKAEAAFARYMQGYGPRGKAFLLSIKREPPRNYRLMIEEKVDLGTFLTRQYAVNTMNSISKVVRELRPVNIPNSTMYVVEFIEGATVDICNVWDYHIGTNTWHQEVIRHVKEKDHVETDETPTE